VPVFRRNATARDPRRRVAEFWSWWAAHRDEVLAAAGDDAAVARLLQPRVAAIHPDLHADLRAGSPAVLTVRAGVGSDLRSVAERWLAAAPPPDERVRFAAAREPDLAGLSRTVEVGGYEVLLSETVVAAHAHRRTGSLDVAVHHPLFTLLGDRSRTWLAGLAVDLALGEDDVERLLGSVTVAVDEPRDAFPISGLRDVAAGLREAVGDDTFVLLEGTDRRGRVVRAMVRRPLSRVDRPLCDTHVTVVLPYTAGRDGQPASPGLVDDVDGLERAAIAALGGEGPHVVLVGHESQQGRFVVHLYVDGLARDPARALRPLIAPWPKSEVHVAADPGWRGAGPLLG
jgi:hypothetical protein